MIKWRYEITDIASAEKMIRSFCNTLIFCESCTIILLLGLSFATKHFINEFIDPFVTATVLIILGIFLKKTSSRALSIIIFITLFLCSISGLLTKTGFSSGTIVAILLTALAFTSVRATFYRFNRMGGQTILKNVLIKNLLAVIYCIILFVIIAFSLAFYAIIKNINLGEFASTITFWFCILSGYYLTFTGKLPFTKKFIMVVYSEKQSISLNEYTSNS